MDVSRAEIIKYCREKMAKYKVPRHVVFMQAHEFPMTSTGKIQKFRLVDMMNERFNIKQA
jgi:fatty-acyl-CoA synthase